MAVTEDPTSGAMQRIDAFMRAARVSLRPMECSAWNSVTERTGAMTGIAAAASIFSFRNAGPNPIVVRRIGIGAIVTTAFTTAQEVAFGVRIARAFTANDTGGTAIALTGSNCKHRTSLGTPTSVDCRIAAAAALGAGAKTLDTNMIGAVGFYAGAVGASLPYAPNNLVQHDAGDYPILLAPNEGFNVQNLVLMGATGVMTGYIGFEFAEVTEFGGVG